MREKLKKRVLFSMILGALMVLMAVPVQAANTRKAQSLTIKAGQCYHIMNQNISRNKMVKYALQVNAAKGAQYDIVYAYSGRAQACKGKSNSMRVENPKADFVKSSNASNSGMAACIKVLKGSVTVKLDYRVGYKNGAFTFVRQSSQHKPLLAVSAGKGKQVYFRMKGGNVNTLPVIISADRKTYYTRRTLNSRTFENYTFEKNYLKYRYWKDGRMDTSKSLNKKYDTITGSKGNILVSMPGRISGWLSTKKGTITYYFPADYLNISVTRK